MGRDPFETSVITGSSLRQKNGCAEDDARWKLTVSSFVRKLVKTLKLTVSL